MPVPGPGVAAPYPQAPFGNPAKSQMGMQAYLDQQNLLAQRMNQQQYQQPPMGRDLYGMPMPLPQQPMGPSAPMSMDIKRPYNPGDDQLIASMMQQTQQPGFLGNTAPQQPMQQQPMGQFQQNNAQQMSNFQNQNQPAQNTQQRSGGMFGRRFGGGSFGGNSGGGGGLF